MAEKDSVIMYKRMCRALKESGFNHERDDARLRINAKVNGDNPIKVMMQIDDMRKLVSYYTHLDFEVAPDDRHIFAQGVCALNLLLADGSFDFNPKTGKCLFRMTSAFRDSAISDEVFNYVLFVANKIVCDYKDVLQLLASGKINLDNFLKLIKEGRDE